MPLLCRCLTCTRTRNRRFKKLFRWHCWLATLFVFYRTLHVVVIVPQDIYSEHSISANTSIKFAQQTQITCTFENVTESPRMDQTTEMLYGPQKHVINITHGDLEKLQFEYENKYYAGVQNVYTRNKVNIFTFDFNMKPLNGCTGNTFMVILVHSRADFSRTRKAIRDTWGSLARGGRWPFPLPAGLDIPEIKLVFMLGLYNESSFMESLTREQLKYDDIVQGNFHDSYINMTLKSLLGLKYVKEECSSVKYMLKSDDDMFLNLPHIITLLYRRRQRRTILGPMNPKSRVNRVGLWGINVRLYPFDRFPIYASGSAYIISSSIVSDLYQTAEYVPWFHVDDAFITGVLPKVVGHIVHERNVGFAFWGSKITTACKIRHNKVYTSTQVTDRHKYKLWMEVGNAQC